MLACDIKPTAATFSCLIAACQQLKDADKAFELYRESCAHGLKEDSAVLDPLIQVCAKTQRYASAGQWRVSSHLHIDFCGSMDMHTRFWTDLKLRETCLHISHWNVRVVPC